MLEVIRSIQALTALAPEWEALCKRTPQATVFQLPQWLLPWWTHFGGGEIFTPVLRQQGELRAIAPLFLHGMPGQSIRQISFIGTGITDYLDCIAAPEVAGSFAVELRELLLQSAAEWDVVNLEELRPGATALQLGESLPLSCCPAIDLPPAAEQFYAALDSTHRRNVRHALKNVTYEPAGMERFDEFTRLHEMSWQDRGETGVLQTDGLRRFYRQASQGLSQIGALRIHTLLSEAKPIGAILAFHFNNRGYAYLGGFDPAHKKQSPGTAIMARAIEQSIQEHLCQWDLLRGEEPYKLLWGARPTYNRKIRMESTRWFF